jgi:hypothetical protein
LWVLNALENIRSYTAYEERLKTITDNGIAARVFKAARDIKMPLKSWSSLKLHPDAVSHLQQAGQWVDKASAVGIGKRRATLDSTIAEEEVARGLLVY